MELLVLILLILLNGVFVLSEMAVVSARKARLQQWSDEGRAGAGTALALAHSPADFLSTTQIAITVITILAGALGEATVSSRLADSLSQFAWLRPYANGLAFWMVVVGVAVCALVLGELVPKRLALINPEGVASAMARPMQLLSNAMSPLVRFMSFVTEVVLRLLGARASGQPPVTEEEINVLMEQGAEAGVFEKHEQAIVSRVFRLDDESIANVMTPRGDIIYFDLSEPFEVNREKLLRSGHSRFVICRGGLRDVMPGHSHAYGAGINQVVVSHLLPHLKEFRFVVRREFRRREAWQNLFQFLAPITCRRVPSQYPPGLHPLAQLRLLQAL